MCIEPTHYILICSTCEGARNAAQLKADMSLDVPATVRFRAVDCLAGCEHSPAVGFQARGKASYLFGSIKSSDDIRAISSFAHQYVQSATGWTSATERPSALFTKTLARLPAIAEGDA